MNFLEKAIAEKRMIVCCGAGGVGKTTTATAISLAAARKGRRVLVLTIDPSRRLAQTLGIDRNLPDPIALPLEKQRAAGIQPPGSLSAWMLDPTRVADQTVRKLTGNTASTQNLMENKIYQNVTQMIAGMQEYTAVEALKQFVDSGEYDLVVLDTPPARNALNFLDAPNRLRGFMEDKVFSLFLPSGNDDEEGAPKKSFLGGLGSGKLITKVLETVFGTEFAKDLKLFLGSFSGILRILNGNAQAMQKRFQQPDAAFILVTSPQDAAIADALYFQETLRRLELPFAGFILNRSRIYLLNREMPERSRFGNSPSGGTAFEKVTALAEQEKHRALEDKKALSFFTGQPVLAAPEFRTGVDDLLHMAEFSDTLLSLKAT